MILPFFRSKLTVNKINKVVDVCNRLGIEPNVLLACMYVETAGTFSTSINQVGTATGLIQFVADGGKNYKTIKGRKYLMSEIKNMTFDEQMDLVFDYLDEVKKAFKVNFHTMSDVYLSIFFPSAIGKSNDWILQEKRKSAQLIATSNKGYDLNKDKKLTKAEVIQAFTRLAKKTGVTDEVLQIVEKKKTNLNNNDMIEKIWTWIKTNKKYIIIGFVVFFVLGIITKKRR